MSKHAIVDATAEQVEQIVPLFVGYLEFYGRPADTGKAREFLRERLARGESVIFLAMLGAVAVGFVQLYPTFASLAMKRSWLVHDLFVMPSARRGGAARALLERAHRLAVESGAEELSLETGRDNVAAQALYQQLGWRRDDEFYRYYLTV